MAVVVRLVVGVEKVAEGSRDGWEDRGKDTNGDDGGACEDGVG